jgi:hypothetical protein
MLSLAEKYNHVVYPNVDVAVLKTPMVAVMAVMAGRPIRVQLELVSVTIATKTD